MTDFATVRSPAQARGSQTLEEAFPEADWLIDPLGNQVIVQLRVPKRTTSGGIIITEDTRDFDSTMVRVGKVVAIGPIAYKHRDSQEPWAEGAWVGIGDFVRVPNFAGIDAWRIHTGTHKETRGGREIEVEDFVRFASFNDYDVKGRIREGRVLDVVDYV